MTARPLRVAVLTDAAHPWHRGGKETRQHELLTRAARAGTDVDVYTMKWWSGPDTVTRDGITYRAICPRLPLYRGGRRSILQALAFSVASLRLVRRDFDLLEADAVPVLQLFPARLVASLRRRRLLATWHEYWGRDYWVQYLGARLGPVAAAAERLAVRMADINVTASDGTRGRLIADAGADPERTVAIPNGIDVTAVATARQQAAPVTADLVVVGRLISHKNVDVALRALRVLHDRGRPLTLAVIGTGPERAALEQLSTDLGLAGHVTFTGELAQHADVLAAMGRARALLFPSVREGFGMVALEAMALGLPVVTSDHPDNFTRDLIDPHGNGELSAVRPDDLADAVERVLADRDQMSEAAGHTASAYSWDRIATRAAAVYAS